MRLRATIFALAACCAVSAWAAEEFPYTAYVNASNVEVRSGPGEDYYPVLKLARRQAVKVYRHDPGGWYAVRPPEECFSWITGEFLRFSEGDLAVVTGDQVAVRVGSQFSDIRDVIQVRLDRGEQVQVLGSTIGAGKTAQILYKIAPPAGEFRWISGRHLDRAPELISQREAAPRHSPLRPRFLREPRVDDQVDHPVDAKHGPALARPSWGLDADPGPDRNHDDKTTDRDQRPLGGDEGWKGPRIRGLTDRRRIDRRALPEEAANAGAASRDPAPDLSLDLHQLNFDEASAEAASPPKKPPPDEWKRASRPIRDYHRPREPTRTGPLPSRTPAAGDRAMTDLKSELADIDLALSTIVAGEPPDWDLSELYARAEAVLARSQTALERGRARHMLGKLEQFANLQERYRAIMVLRYETDQADRQLHSITR